MSTYVLHNFWVFFFVCVIISFENTGKVCSIILVGISYDHTCIHCKQYIHYCRTGNTIVYNNTNVVYYTFPKLNVHILICSIQWQNASQQVITQYIIHVVYINYHTYTYTFPWKCNKHIYYYEQNTTKNKSKSPLTNMRGVLQFTYNVYIIICVCISGSVRTTCITISCL